MCSRTRQSREGNRCARQVRKNISPGMFPANGLVGIPDVSKRGGPAQIINMPMRTSRQPGMMTDPRPYSARSQGAANVDVAARLNGELAQPSNLDGLRRSACKIRA